MPIKAFPVCNSGWQSHPSCLSCSTGLTPLLPHFVCAAFSRFRHFTVFMMLLCSLNSLKEKHSSQIVICSQNANKKPENVVIWVDQSQAVSFDLGASVLSSIIWDWSIISRYQRQNKQTNQQGTQVWCGDIGREMPWSLWKLFGLTIKKCTCLPCEFLSFLLPAMS